MPEENKREQLLIEYIRSVSPEEMLVDMLKGKEPEPKDLKTLEGLRKIGLSDGVINVLIQYVMVKTDMKLTKNYIEKIAGQWRRKKIESIEEAMEEVKREHKHSQAHKNQYQNTTNTLNKVNAARLEAIEKAVKNPNITDEQLGKFIRSIFQN